MAIQRSKSAAILRTKKQNSLGREGFKYNCLHAYKKQPYTIVIDWLQFACKLNTTFMNLGADFVHKDYRWLYTGHGTQHYKHLYHVYQANTHMFTVQVSPKLSKHENFAVVKLENWLLYADWFSHYEDFRNSFIDEVIRISRLDIALDGMTHVRDLIAECFDGQKHHYKLIGKSKVDAYSLNRITGKPDGYRVGTHKGHKMVIVYNKTKELKKGAKPYIPDYWDKNGLSHPADVYRFECRMKSGFLNRVLNANGDMYTPESLISELRSDGMKISVVTLFLEGFLEFVYKDDINVSRCTRIKIIPDAAFTHAKSKLEKKPTNYKSRLTIHNLYAQLCAGQGDVEGAIGVMAKQLEYHDLYGWYASKLQDYSRLYVDELGTIKPLLHSLVGLKPKTTVSPENPDLVRSRLHDTYYAEVIPTVHFCYKTKKPIHFNHRQRAEPVKDEYICRK